MRYSKQNLKIDLREINYELATSKNINASEYRNLEQKKIEIIKKLNS